ncbi:MULTISPECIES: GNAT family N-acetyltransferase [unclassified Veillonella]|uniref:GNAT family N-acetyltransferase n=1 Tax=unclassified Veillonella TaxID=2630086 RepID=UPI000F8DEC11|nr:MULTISPECIES: GNAT family N-acetyltransferase [unclassified Veillonella]
MNFEIRNGHDYIDEVKDLFVEYVQSLGVSASVREFHGLEDKYKGEGEALYIAFIDNKPAGCVALRYVDSKTAAMKRLYVRPAFRHSSLGTNMAKLVVEDAREFGYKTLLLDSLPSMENAKELYTNLGFKKLDGTKKSVKTVVHLSLPL